MKWLAFALVGFVAVVLTQCGLGMPGTTLGIYTVSGVMQTNTCGAGLEAPSPWKFNVELSQQTSTLFWNAMDGSPLLTGTVAGSAVTMDDTTSGTVDNTADGGPGACIMTRSDVLALTFAAGTPPSAFTGTLTYNFSAGPACSDQLSAQGGIYDTLPCTVAYNLNGSYAGRGE
jgi:hypothetical protein